MVDESKVPPIFLFMYDKHCCAVTSCLSLEHTLIQYFLMVVFQLIWKQHVLMALCGIIMEIGTAALNHN